MTDVVGTKTLEIMSQAPWYNNWLLSKIAPYLSGSILEVGAGIGNMTKYFMKYGKVTAIDYDRDYLPNLAKLEVSSGFGDIENGKFFFKNKKFDTVVSTNVFEHIKNDNKSIANVYKLLNKGGKFVLMVPAHMWAYGTLDKELGHFRRYTTVGLSKQFREAGFTVIHSQYLNWFSVMGWIINGRVLKRKIIPLGQLKYFNFLAPIFLFPEKFIKPPFGQSVLIVGVKK